MRIPSVLTLAACLAPALAGMAPAFADPMNAQSAERFVYGRTFFYTCYEGTAGAGRILDDGSVAGTIQMRGKGNVRYVALPAGTILVRGEKVCAKVKGLAFQPCFDLDKTGEQSFRGNLAGADKMWCEFKRGGSGRTRMAERATPKRNDVATADEKAPSDPPH
ncbi:hypothetical protein FHS55_001304 [Angulomicrobium tetraedrale]|uniref:Uncharacterized protein n=1 Tax=Ancylobacter tetraedralis TaxID=217068 RepID=A0A839Z505_9HYPH|nr:hypothetical protein [Ancylobacter tetraedralis]MBB3770709.1 hypothetical protein [Ancylobacter tetraedralis]